MTRQIRVALGAALGIAALLSARAPVVSGDALTAKVDKVFDQWDRPDSPGCALGVVQHGRLLYERGYGSANLDYGLPITPATVFDIGSVSKQFTSTSIVLLAQRGRLALDDDIRKYVPELPAYETPITIRHLVHHTSGIRDYLTLMEFAGLPFEDVYTDDQLIRLLARQKALNFKPGDEYLYSNSGYILLAAIVKRMTGRPFGAFAEANIFKPLGMANTRVFEDRTAVVTNRATGYAPRGEGGFRVEYYPNFTVAGDGQVYTTVEDLFRWDQNLYQDRIGGPGLVDQLLTRGRLNTGETIDYAFALSVGEYRGLKTVSHGGSWAGFRAHFLRFPDQQFSVICLCNLATANPSALAKQVADVYLADRFKTSDAAGRAPAASVRLTAAQIGAIAGAYRNPLTGAVWAIGEKDAQLTVTVGATSFPLGAVDAMRFRSADPERDVAIVFERAPGGGRPTMRVAAGSQKPATFEPVDLVKPGARELSEYAGQYFSEELQTVYRIRLVDGVLRLARGKAEDAAFAPTVRDAFVVDGFTVEFARDSQGRVAGLTVRAGRVKDIRFTRTAAGS